jgi:hypothetical protein
MLIRTLLIKVMRTCPCDHGRQTLQGSILSLHASILGSTALKLLNFDLNADPDPAFHSDVDPASKNNADLCGSGSATMQYTTMYNVHDTF